jgi:peroxiredoxin
MTKKNHGRKEHHEAPRPAGPGDYIDFTHKRRAEPAARGGILQSGTRAPDFDLHATPDQRVCLDDFRGKNLVVMFYPADWSPVCSDEVVLFNEVLPEIHKHNAELVAVSVDGVWSHMAFSKDRGLHYPLLADFEPKGAVAQSFGAFRSGEGVCERALFVIDPEGVIRWSYLSPVGIDPGADGVLNALEQLSLGAPSGRTAEGRAGTRQGDQRKEESHARDADSRSSTQSTHR